MASFGVSIVEEGEEDGLAINNEQQTTESAAAASSSRAPVHPLAGGESRVPMPMPSLDLDSLSIDPRSGTSASLGAAASGPEPPPPSMLSLLGILNNYRMRVKCQTLDNLFGKINVDARTWSLLVRSQLPRNDHAMGLEQLLDTVTEFVKRLNRKSSSRVPTILDNVMYTEEVNFAYRVYSRSSTLFGQIFRYLKPLFAEMETYIEERGQLPCFSLKAVYNEVKPDLDLIYAKLEVAAQAEAEKAMGKEDSKTGSNIGSNFASNVGSKRASVNGVGARRSRTSSRRGSLKDDARKKAAIAAALANSAVAAAKDEDLATRPSSAGGTIPPHKSMRSSIEPPQPTTHSTPLRMRTLSQSTHEAASPPPPPSFQAAASSVDAAPSTPSTSAAALAAQALAAAAEAQEAAERLMAEEGDDSEEDTTESGARSSDDIFSKLLSAAQSHQYPLPPRLRRKPLPRPHPEFLASYMTHHAKGFHWLESLLDCYLLCLLCALVALALTETLQKRDLYAAIMSEVNTLASHFVRLGLPLADRLLATEPSFMRENIMHLSFAQVERGVAYSDARQCVRKCRLLHALFASLDIFVFPRAVPAHNNGLKCIAPSHFANENFVATGGYDQALRIWDLKRNKCLAQFIGHKSIVTWCAFSSVDTWLASASFDGTIRIWNARTGECLRVLEGHTDAILDADLGAKDKYIVSGSMDCSVRLWATTTGKCLRIYTGHKHWVKTVRFANDDQTILSGGLDNRIFIWNLRSASGTGGPRHTLAHADYVLDLCVISPQRFLSASKDRTIRAWDPRTGKQELELSNPSGSTALTLSLSPDGTLVAAGFFDNTINIYDIARGCSLVRQIKVHNDGILCLRWTDNRTIVVGTATGSAQCMHI